MSYESEYGSRKHAVYWTATLKDGTKIRVKADTEEHARALINGTRTAEKAGGIRDIRRGSK